MRLNPIIKSLCVTIFWLSTQCYAADDVDTKVRTFASDEGARLVIVPFGEYKDNLRLAYFKSFNHEWDDKVILLYYNDKANLKIYAIHINTGKKMRPIDKHNVIVDSGIKTLKNASATPMISVYLKNRQKPIQMYQIESTEYSAETIKTLYKTQNYADKR